MGQPIPVTFGRRGFASSASAVLASSLVSRLKARLPTVGSTLFSMTWKARTTPRYRLVSLLRASARSTGDRGSGSWPTPNAGPQNDQDATWQARRAAIKAEGKNGNGFGLTLGMAASLAPWPTTTRQDALGSGRLGYVKDDRMTSGMHSGTTLTDAANLATWRTPNASDAKERVTTQAASDRRIAKGQQIGIEMQVEMQAIGTTRDGLCAETGKRGRLNPALSRWLMGYPPAWDACAVMAMPSSRKSRKSSSKPIWRREV
jgi:hypothetical protein